MSDRPMRIMIVIASLRAGGAERQASIMANYWARKGCVVHLLTFVDAIEPSFYPLDPDIIRLSAARQAAGAPIVAGGPRSVGQKRQWRSRLKHNINNLFGLIHRILALRAAIRKYRADIVISFVEMTNVTVLLATIGLGIPVIVSERTDPSQHPIGIFWSALRKLTYPQASCVVVQTAAAMNYFAPRVRSSGRVIPNPVLVPRIENDAATLNNERDEKTWRVVMAMGRLDQNKNFDRLIRVFSDLAPQRPEWILEIWGEGPLRKFLEALVERLGLQDRVRLPGVTKEPWQKMRQADLFVLSSRYEGFPNVLCEAMACGLPVISFDCPSGPSEIIRDGIDGVLVPPGDEAALAAAMARLMDHPEERERLAARAPEVLDRFSLEKVMTVWNEVIHEARLGKEDRCALSEMKGRQL